MKTSNPALSANAFRLPYAGMGESMTISGAVNKTGILLICAVLTAAWSWNQCEPMGSTNASLRSTTAATPKSGERKNTQPRPAGIRRVLVVLWHHTQP